MRILVLASLFPPHNGGAPRVVEQFVDRMVDSGHTVDVLTHHAPFASTAEENDGARGYEVHRLPELDSHRRSLVQFTKAAVALTHRRRSASRAFDLVVCGMAYPVVMSARTVELVTRTPFIVYVHGEDVTIIGGSRAKAIALKNSLRHAQSVLVNSAATGRLLVDVGLSDDDFEVMPPSIDPDRFGDVDATLIVDLRSRFGLEDRRVLLTVATLDRPRKGHDVVVRSIGQLADEFPDLAYVVVGGGSADSLRELATDHRVSEHLTIIDWLSDDDLAALFSVAEIYVMPSRWDPDIREVEGFGIAYLEAAAAGRPSVAGTAGGASEAVVDGQTGLCVDPESVDAVADALRRLLGDPAFAQRLGQAACARASAEFSEDVVLGKFDAALRSAVRVR